MDKRVDDGWNEPVNEALWRTKLLFNVPAWTLAAWPLALLVASVAASPKPLWVASAWQAVVVGLTQADPEWPQIVRGMFSEPGEIDP
jgi:hypothetical protein